MAALRQGVRRFSQLAGQALKDAMVAEQKHAHATSMQWKKISLFIAFPAMALCTYNAVTDELEHMAHHEQPEFKTYSHLRIRKTSFPWGDGNHSLFHGPNNPLPEGYEI